MGCGRALVGNKNHQSTVAGINVITNAAGDVTSLLGKTIACDTAGRMGHVTAAPPYLTGLNGAGSQTTLSRYNGQNRRCLRQAPAGQPVYTCAPDGYSVPAETEHPLIGATTVSNTRGNALPAHGQRPYAGGGAHQRRTVWVQVSRSASRGSIGCVGAGSVALRHLRPGLVLHAQPLPFCAAHPAGQLVALDAQNQWRF
jgi:hypothetical protein